MSIIDFHIYCTACKKVYTASAKYVFYERKGCPYCGDKKYKFRILNKKIVEES